jgi:hypothetical protein
MDQGRFAQVAFSFGALLGKDVIGKGLIPHDFP